MNFRRAISVVGVSTFVLSGCSTTYAPRPNPRVAVVMQGGTPVYLREGRVFPGGGFGGDLGDAVQGNPQAESYAKAYRTNMIAGVTTTLAGVLSAVGGSILYASSSSRPDNERSSSTEAIGGTLAVSGLAAYITGMVLMLNAQPHLWDAVNAYNDSVDPASLRSFAQPGAAPTAPNAPSTPTGIAPNGSPVALRSDSTNFPSMAPPPITLPQSITLPAPTLGAIPNATEPPSRPTELHGADVDVEVEAQ